MLGSVWLRQLDLPLAIQHAGWARVPAYGAAVTVYAVVFDFDA